MKTCTRCNEAKPLEAFKPAKRHVDGLTYWCRDCFNAAARATYDPQRERERRARNAPQRTAYQVRYRADNAAARVLATLEWAKANPEKWLAQKRRHNRKAAGELTDSYVRRQLTRRSRLTPEQVPQGLVELKRAHLKLARELGKEDREDC